MLIYLLRHGMTELGQQKRYQGALDTPLSDAGRTALRPAKFGTDVVYVSPLLRARETAALLFPGAAQRAVPGLREMNFGIFEGRGWWEMENDPAYRAWVDSGCMAQCPGGESRQVFSERVCAAFQQLVTEEKACGRERLVIVAHGGTQMAALERWGRPARDYYAWQTGCGAGWLLDSAAWPNGLQIVKEVSFTL